MAILMISSSSSQCSACNGNAKPSERFHIHGGPKSGYDKDSNLNCTNGCGEEFTDIQSTYYDGSGRTMEEMSADFRKRFWGEK